MDRHRTPPPHPSHAVVFAGGDLVPVVDPGLVPDGALVIAADSGLVHAQRFGVRVHLVVGDLDSAPRDAVAAAEGDGARIERHRPDKDQTDLELALIAAVRRGVRSIEVVGGGGGRPDHFLANVALLCAPAFADDVALSAHLGGARLVVVRPGPPTVLAAELGALVSLLPMHGPAVGVVTGGLRYPLDDELLAAGSPRGMSNVVEEAPATVSLRVGVLAVVLADADPSDAPTDA